MDNFQCQGWLPSAPYQLLSVTIRTMAEHTPTIGSLQNGDAPFVLASHKGVVLALNPAFQQVYGWSEAELVGTPLGRILPEAFLMSHELGFSRFRASGTSSVLGHPLRLSTRCADGSEIVSDHFILAEQREDGWVFGASLTPLPEGTPPDQSSPHGR
jgi:PAS domain S-box-containing protein